jgi:hypothetical protein
MVGNLQKGNSLNADYTAASGAALSDESRRRKDTLL